MAGHDVKPCSNDQTGQLTLPFSETETTISVVTLPAWTADPSLAVTLCLLLC